MGTLDAWLFVGEVFAILGLFWLMLMWVLNRIDDAYLKQWEDEDA